MCFWASMQGKVSPLACQARRFPGQGRQLPVSFTGRCRTLVWSWQWKDGGPQEEWARYSLAGKGGRASRLGEAGRMGGRGSTAWAATLPGFCSHWEAVQEAWGT